jgi:hypothetical protein
MSKSYILVAVLFASAVPMQLRAQQSLQAMHTHVPAPPATAAAAPAWLTSAEVTTLRQQLKDQRAFVEKLNKDAAAASLAGASGGGIDFARAQRDPAYAKELQAKIAKMSPDEQMKLAMEMQKATQSQALQDVQAMADDSDAVQLAAEHYPDYQMKQSTGGITAQYAAVNAIRQRVSTREMEIAAKAEKALKCSDGEGSCSAADRAADKATLRAAYEQIIGEYNKALVEISAQVVAARKARAPDIAAAQKDLGPAQYGAAAKSNTNKQLLAAYHNAVLMEVEQLFILSEDTAKWAATRVNDRKVNFVAID